MSPKGRLARASSVNETGCVPTPRYYERRGEAHLVEYPDGFVRVLWLKDDGTSHEYRVRRDHAWEDFERNAGVEGVRWVPMAGRKPPNRNWSPDALANE
jgi:hypothetical protein